jgi:hypothetical protein
MGLAPPPSTKASPVPRLGTRVAEPPMHVHGGPRVVAAAGVKGALHKIARWGVPPALRKWVWHTFLVWPGGCNGCGACDESGPGGHTQFLAAATCDG